MATILARKTSKQAWSQAATLVMLDSAERLRDWVAGMNETAGWNQYAVEDEASKV